MGQSARSLASLEIAVRRGCRALSARHHVAVRSAAHRTARIAPFEARREEYPVQAFRFSLPLDARGTRHNDRGDDRVAPLHDLRCRPQVFDTRIRARADEHTMHLDAGQRRIGRELHVLERAFHAAPAFGVVDRRRIGHAPGDRRGVLGARAPAHHGRKRRCVQSELAIKTRVGVRRQGTPVFERAVPVGAPGRIRPAVEILIGRVIGGNHADPRAGLDRHVAYREAALYRHAPYRGSGILHRVPDRAADADARDDGENDVLRRHVRRQRSVDRDAHGFRLFLPQRLGRENVAQLVRLPDRHCESAERPLGRRVRVTADDEQAGLREPQLGSDHVRDALPRIVHADVLDSELARVLVEPFDDVPDLRIGDACGASRAIQARQVMIGDGQRLPGLAHLAPFDAQLVEREERSAFVHEIPVDEQQILAARTPHDDVLRPDFVEHGARFSQSLSPRERTAFREGFERD